VVGIHVISYFISRATPVFRDRPTVRPGRDMDKEQEQQVLARLSQTLPLLKHGSLSRAIGHNRAQTMILGVNQLTTGLFRTFSEFSGKQFGDRDGLSIINDRILPILPVHDILHTLRIYHDPKLRYLRFMETAFPAGNSAFGTLREDNDSINLFVGLLQKELLRRQGLDVTQFFIGDKINVELLPVFRPDIAVLLQPDIFNTDINSLISKTESIEETEWSKQVGILLQMPIDIQHWREKIWQLIQDPIRQQVESFVELAHAIYALSINKISSELPFSAEPTNVQRLESQITHLLRGGMDDRMRQFLISAVKYLTQLPGQMAEVPIDILRALRDVERILRIEKQILGKQEQDLVRHYILNIARLCGENG
jgi:hypothetical protein